MRKVIYWDGTQFLQVDELQTAEQTTIQDEGQVYASTDVENALQEVGSNMTNLESFAIAMAIGLS